MEKQDIPLTELQKDHSFILWTKGLLHEYTDGIEEFIREEDYYNRIRQIIDFCKEDDCSVKQVVTNLIERINDYCTVQFMIGGYVYIHKYMVGMLGHEKKLSAEHYSVILGSDEKQCAYFLQLCWRDRARLKKNNDPIQEEYFQKIYRTVYYTGNYSKNHPEYIGGPIEDIGTDIIQKDIEFLKKIDLSEWDRKSPNEVIANPQAEKGANIIPQQEVDTEVLKTYFKPKFKGMGGNLDYFSVFTDDLKTLNQPIDFARVALMCYEGDQMNSLRPAAFSKWYRTFCKIVGCIHTTMDNKNKIRSNIPQNMKDRFSYLG
jgi:hypothetical protein